MTPLLTDNETMIALLDIQTKIAHCGDHWLIRNTLRDKARTIAAQFVDPNFEEPAHPALRDSMAMAADTDPHCGF